MPFRRYLWVLLAVKQNPHRPSVGWWPLLARTGRLVRASEPLASLWYRGPTRRNTMKSLLSLFGLLGLAVVFGMSEPVPASTQPITSDDVRLVSEQTSSEIGQKAGKNGNSGKKRTGGGIGGRRLRQSAGGRR